MSVNPLNRSYVYLKAVALVVAFVVLLSAFNTGIESLKGLAIIYLFMLLPDLSFLLLGMRSEPLATPTIIGLVGLFIISLLFGLIGRWEIMGVYRFPETFTLTIHGLSVSPIVLTLFAQLFGPVAEEAFFRVFLMQMLAIAIGGFWMPLIAQAVTFGVFHWWAYGGDLIGITSATVSGLWLGYIYHRYGNEAAISLAHMIYNMVIVVLGAVA